MLGGGRGGAIAKRAEKSVVEEIEGKLKGKVTRDKKEQKYGEGTERGKGL